MDGCVCVCGFAYVGVGVCACVEVCVYICVWVGVGEGSRDEGMRERKRQRELIPSTNGSKGVFKMTDANLSKTELHFEVCDLLALSHAGANCGATISNSTDDTLLED